MNRYDDSTEDWSVDGMEAELSGENAGTADSRGNLGSNLTGGLHPLSRCLNCGVTHEFARGLCIVDYIEGYPVYGDHEFAPLEVTEYIKTSKSLIDAHTFWETEYARSGNVFVDLSRKVWLESFLTKAPTNTVLEILPVRGLYLDQEAA